MSLQEIFYLLGIIFMSLTILIVLAAGIVSFLAIRKALKIYRQTTEGIDRAKYLATHPLRVVEQMGAGLARVVLDKLADWIRPRSQARQNP
ncbi:MAG: hypothetical protein NUV73_02870 [Candidatus Daviesbacteria bacterium]|nr:hypothetical protein [Candidatus Daviesbacteria bacterium]